MNAWICDCCGTIRRDRPLGWLNVRSLVEQQERPTNPFLYRGDYDNERMFCSTDCIAAAFMLQSVEEKERG